MRLFTSFVAIIAIGLLISTTAFCQESPFQFSVGLVQWFSRWDTDFFKGSGFGSWGPKIGVGYKNFGLGIVFLNGNFDLDIKGGGKADADRSDLDVILQYRINQYISASLGLKYFTYNMSSKTQSIEESLTGAGLGLGGYYPFAESGFYAYGLISYLPALNIDYSAKISGFKESDSGDGSAFNAEGGVGYLFTRIPISIDVGYRHQTVDKKGLTKNTSDVFSGPAIDVSYAF
jgi:hypothetical protein